MSVLASPDMQTLWEITLLMGAVVIAVVIVLMMLLLSFIKDIEEGAGVLLETAGGIAKNTSAIPQLATTASVLEDIKAEALVQHAYLTSQTRGL